MKGPIQIAIGIDKRGWHNKFASALDRKMSEGYPCTYRRVNMLAHDWLEQLRGCELVVWKPGGMGPRSAGYIKEKIYFLQHILHVFVVPNFESIWHFESKIAQSYLFLHAGIRVPRTTASFDYDDAHRMLESAELPLVFKLSEGAGSANVQLIRSTEQARRRLDNTFCEAIWKQAREEHGSKTRTILYGLGQRWLAAKAWRTATRGIAQEEGLAHVYWQQFIPNNEKDLRITVIGDRFAYGFWRKNRPNDFRASGSGLIEYDRPIPEGPLRYCLDLNRRFNFDSMCYDILFTREDFVLTEMSFGYLDVPLYKTPGHHVLSPDGQLSYVAGHVWPQELWIEWALHRLESAGGA